MGLLSKKGPVYQRCWTKGQIAAEEHQRHLHRRFGTSSGPRRKRWRQREEQMIDLEAVDRLVLRPELQQHLRLVQRAGCFW